MHHIHHHLHHHMRKHARSFIVKSAVHHPVVTGLLAVIGGIAVLKAFTAKQSTTSGGAA